MSQKIWVILFSLLIAILLISSMEVRLILSKVPSSPNLLLKLLCIIPASFILFKKKGDVLPSLFMSLWFFLEALKTDVSFIDLIVLFVPYLILYFKLPAIVKTLAVALSFFFPIISRTYLSLSLNVREWPIKLLAIGIVLFHTKWPILYSFEPLYSLILVLILMTDLKNREIQRFLLGLFIIALTSFSDKLMFLHLAFHLALGLSYYLSRKKANWPFLLIFAEKLVFILRYF